jgi:hypothetical protein
LLRDLARVQGRALVSCYVHFARAGKDVRQNAIQLKKCQRALAAAHAAGAVDAHTTNAATRELAHAAQAAENPRAPRRTDLALFASSDECRALESPVPFASSITIAPRYYVVPLVPLTMSMPPALVLALSRHSVRLIDRASARELPLPADTPRSLEDAVGPERRTPGLQQHSVGAGAVFHGHGEGSDDVLRELETYCRRIVNALTNEIARSAATVVLAGDVQITAIFRRAAAGWRVLGEQIYGNHDRTPAAQLAAFATPLAGVQLSAANAELKTLYWARSAEHRASDDPREIASAARAGRIDTLLLEHSAALDEPGLRAAREPSAVSAEGPFNSEAVLTLRSGGDVRIVPAADMPTAAPQAAILRF